MLNDALSLSMFGAMAAIAIAQSVRKRAPGRATLRTRVAQLTDQVDRQAAALEHLEATSDTQLAQLGELQERLDMAERLLIEYRERGADPVAHRIAGIGAPST